MPYITTEKVAQKRAILKKEFPASDGWVLSITKRHDSTICVAVMAGPIELRDEPESDRKESVNTFYIKEHNRNNPEKERVLQKIVDILEDGNEIICHDSDYGAVPRFYTDVTIGQWDKPFKLSTGNKPRI